MNGVDVGTEITPFVVVELHINEVNDPQVPARTCTLRPEAVSCAPAPLTLTSWYGREATNEYQTSGEPASPQSSGIAGELFAFMRVPPVLIPVEVLLGISTVAFKQSSFTGIGGSFIQILNPLFVVVGIVVLIEYTLT